MEVKLKNDCIKLLGCFRMLWLTLNDPTDVRCYQTNTATGRTVTCRSNCTSSCSSGRCNNPSSYLVLFNFVRNARHHFMPFCFRNNCDPSRYIFSLRYHVP